MRLDPDICYRALLSRDSRFDGRFYVGVDSTGIYCRPICRVRAPRRANCRFFVSAAAAERAGFRPCLRCRPELAPDLFEGASRLVHAAVALLEAAPGCGLGPGELARRLSVSERHLRRVFAAELGVSPGDYLRSRRLLLAKRLLTDTALSVTEIAHAAGFGSVRSLNAAFRGHYRLQPRALRRTGPVPDGTITLSLAYCPPYAWQAQLDFLAARALAGVEEVSQRVYRRNVVVAQGAQRTRGWLQVAQHPRHDTLQVVVCGSLAAVVPAVLQRVRRLFDLDCRPDQIAAALGPLAAARPGLRVPGAFDGFEVAVRAVLGQQVTLGAARTLAGRFAARFGVPIATPHPALTHTFPTPAEIVTTAPEEIGALGITRVRVRAIQALAQALIVGELVLEPGADVEAQLLRLRALPGIGAWTAQYIAMRALAWPDAFPETDHGVRKALGETSRRRVRALAEPWRPWRAYATLHLWNALAAGTVTPQG